MVERGPTAEFLGPTSSFSIDLMLCVLQ